jgi:hypothetical protein
MKMTPLFNGCEISFQQTYMIAEQYQFISDLIPGSLDSYEFVPFGKGCCEDNAAETAQNICRVFK